MSRGPSAETRLASRAEFRENWTLVMAAAIGMSFSSVTAAATGPFMEPMGKEFGWSRTLLSSGLSITSFLTFFLSPYFGLLIDRYGTRRMALPGLMLMAVMMAAFSLNTGATAVWISMWLFYAVAALAVKSTVWTAGVQSVFDSGRGLALGLTLSGIGVAQAVTPPLATWLIAEFGWRMAWVWLGLGWGGVATVICWKWLFDGYDISKRKRKARGEVLTGKAPLLDVPGLSIPQAWRDEALWRIAISTFIMMVITIALNVHQFQILVESGVQRSNAAWLATIAGIAGILGKLATGWLLDRYHPRWVGGLTLGSTAIAFMLLTERFSTPTLIVVAMFINGYAAGTKLQIAGYLTAAYGGMRNFGAIYGAIASLIAAGSGLGPLVAGLVYDAYGNYGPFLIAGMIGSLVSGWLIFGLGAYPDWKKSEAEAALA